MDDIDRIQENEDLTVKKRLAAIQREMSNQPKSIYCVDCGEELAEERRKALPHAVRCFECQSLVERHRRFHR